MDSVDPDIWTTLILLFIKVGLANTFQIKKYCAIKNTARFCLRERLQKKSYKTRLNGQPFLACPFMRASREIIALKQFVSKNIFVVFFHQSPIK